MAEVVAEGKQEVAAYDVRAVFIDPVGRGAAADAFLSVENIIPLKRQLHCLIFEKRPAAVQVKDGLLIVA